jgi:GT2 family glycosyltransferase
MIQKHFYTYSSVGVIGYTTNANPTNIPSNVEDIYYNRLLLEGIFSPSKISLLLTGACIDFRNAAFLAQFIKRFRFNTNLLISCEDVEMGLRLYAASSAIHFNPTIIVSHNNSIGFNSLFRRNFKTGYATQDLMSNWGVRKEQIRRPYNKQMWRNYCIRTRYRLKGIHRKLVFLGALQIYPWFSRLGRLVFILKLPLEWFLPNLK